MLRPPTQSVRIKLVILQPTLTFTQFNLIYRLMQTNRTRCRHRYIGRVAYKQPNDEFIH